MPCIARRCPYPARECNRSHRGIASAKLRINCSFAAAAMRGSPKMTDLPPPCGKPAAAFFHVIARASRKHSLDGNVRRHADAADRRATGGIVDNNDRLQRKTGAVNVDDAGRAELIRKSKHIFHAVCA